MRRKKPRVVWFPSTNANSVGTAPNFTSNIQDFIVDLASPHARGNIASGEIPLIIDGDLQDPLDPAVSMADIEASGYRLRRVVGNIWVAATQSANAAIKDVICTAGLIIRQYDPTTGFSIAQTTGQQAQIAPGEISNINDPWIWRRSWCLSNLLSTFNTLANGFQLAGMTHNFANQEGALGSGSHVDARTARVVGPEHRLFLDVNLTAMDTQAADAAPFQVRIRTDLRVLGSPRSSLGNRRNASR